MTFKIEIGPKTDSWSAPRVIPAEETGPIEVVTLKQARDDLENTVTDHLVRGKPGLLIVTGIPGLGKTTITVQESERVADETGTNIAWFGTRHNQFDAVPRSTEWRHVMGRNEDNCPYYQDARRIARKGWSVTEVLCGDRQTPGRCSIGRGNCAWWKQWKGNLHRYMPSQHLPAAPLWERPGLRLVFDELDARNFVPEPVPVTFEALYRGTKAWLELSPVLEQLMDFLLKTEGTRLADTPLFDSLSQTVDTIPCHLPTVTLPKESSQADQIPSRHIIGLLSQLSNELWRHRQGQEFVSRVAVHQGKFVYCPRMDLPEEIFSHPAVLLNSTADVSALRHLLERPDYPVEVYSPDIALHPATEVKYVLDANHSKTTVQLADQEYSERWEERVLDGIEGNPRTLVVATKDGESQLAANVGDLTDNQVGFAHYGAVSGLNEYEEYEGIVLSQPFNPPPFAVAELYRRIYGGRGGEPLRLETCPRRLQLPAIPGEEHTYEVTVTSMQDERLAPLYEHWRWSEMYQAAHRVRPVLHERHIVITCAIPLDGLPPTSVSYFTRKTETAARLQEAADRLLAQDGHFTQKELAHEAGFDISTVSRHWDQVIRDMELTIIEVAVPSPRYPNGRMAKAATHVCTSL